MLCVETEVKPSKIHGYGVFAKNDIPKGTIVWETKTGFDRMFSKEHYRTLNEVQKEFVKRTFSTCKDYFHSYCDYAILTNHSNNPNIVLLSDSNAIAAKNIKAGEELTQDYGFSVFYV